MKYTVSKKKNFRDASTKGKLNGKSGIGNVLKKFNVSFLFC